MTAGVRLDDNQDTLRGFATICAAFVAACGFSASTNPGGGGGDDVSPVDASGGETAEDDVDGDGIANAIDNCPMKANPGQFDEDGDDTGDDCDRCPHLALPTADVDDDGDGVGNGCDPRPTQGGDEIAYWNGFNEARAGLPDTLRMLHGPVARWSVADGDLVYTHAANDTDWGMPVVDVAKPNHVIDAAFDIMADFSAVASAGGVAVDIPATDTDGFECQSRVDLDYREMWRRNPNMTGGWTLVDDELIATPNDSYRITLQRTATDVLCTNIRGTQTPVMLASTTDSLGNTRVGLFARNVDMRFRYMIVITSP